MRILILLFGIFCCSVSVIFIRMSATDPIALSAWRLLLGSLFLLPMALRAQRRTKATFLQRRLWLQALPPAVLLAIHFISWIIGARLTPSANASLLVNMVPIVMPFLLFFVLHERLTRPELFGTLIALLGIVLLGITDFNLSPEYALGDAICFASMLFYASYLLFARKNRTQIASIYLYVVPVYALAGLICLAAALLFDLFTQSPVAWVGPNLPVELLAILGLAIVPTVLGHSIINWALTHLPGQTVVILNLAQFVFAGLMGYAFMQEVPHPSFYLISAIIISGATVVIHASYANGSAKV